MGPGLIASFRSSMTKLQVGDGGGDRHSASGLDRLASTESRGGSESGGLSSRNRRSSDDDPFAGLDTPMSTRDLKKACMVCMDKERGEERREGRGGDARGCEGGGRPGQRGSVPCLVAQAL